MAPVASSATQSCALIVPYSFVTLFLVSTEILGFTPSPPKKKKNKPKNTHTYTQKLKNKKKNQLLLGILGYGAV